MQGTLKKMSSRLAGVVEYDLRLGEERVPLNPFIGKTLTLEYTGAIYCDACGRKTKKSFSQGHCFPCMKKLARCDMCIMKPETCHFAAGTCREPEWGEAQCMVPHYVYLSNTSGLKVGITRHTQLPTRWIDQGATQGLPILKVRSRYISGLVEVALGEFIADKTNWRAMLKGNNEPMDLRAQAHCLLPQIQQRLEGIKAEFGEDAIEVLDESVVDIHYPVSEFPTKVSTFNFDKTPRVSGTLMGIKGQYLIFDSGVINLRKFTGYEVRVVDE